jgi:hypothetical protein
LEITKQEPIDIKKKKKMEMDWALFKETAGAIEKDILVSNPQVARRRGRPRKTWRTIEEEITEMVKTWREVKALANLRKRWRSFTGDLCSIRN